VSKGINEQFLSELVRDMRDNGVDDEEFIAAVVDDLRMDKREDCDAKG
jgi:hypothetical protein